MMEWTTARGEETEVCLKEQQSETSETWRGASTRFVKKEGFSEEEWTKMLWNVGVGL